MSFAYKGFLVLLACLLLLGWVNALFFDKTYYSIFITDENASTDVNYQLIISWIDGNRATGGGGDGNVWFPSADNNAWWLQNFNNKEVDINAWIAASGGGGLSWANFFSQYNETTFDANANRWWAAKAVYIPEVWRDFNRFSGSYLDLNNLPTIPPLIVDTNIYTFSADANAWWLQNLNVKDLNKWYAPKGSDTNVYTSRWLVGTDTNNLAQDWNAFLSIDLNALGVRSFVDFNAQVVNPANPLVGIDRVFAQETQGHTRLVLMDDEGVQLVLGRDNRFIAKNTTASIITKGQAVYVSGSTGTVPNIGLAKADVNSTMPAIGVAQADIGVNAFGYVMKLGILTTNTSAFTAGDSLWVSELTAGGLTKTRPPFPYLAQRMGVILVSGVGNGSLLVTTASGINGLDSGSAVPIFKVYDLNIVSGGIIVGDKNYLLSDLNRFTTMTDTNYQTAGADANAWVTQNMNTTFAGENYQLNLNNGGDINASITTTAFLNLVNAAAPNFSIKTLYTDTGAKDYAIRTNIYTYGDFAITRSNTKAGVITNPVLKITPTTNSNKANSFDFNGGINLTGDLNLPNGGDINARVINADKNLYVGNPTLGSAPARLFVKSPGTNTTIIGAQASGGTTNLFQLQEDTGGNFQFYGSNTGGVTTISLQGDLEQRSYIKSAMSLGKSTGASGAKLDINGPYPQLNLGTNDGNNLTFGWTEGATDNFFIRHTEARGGLYIRDSANRNKLTYDFTTGNTSLIDGGDLNVDQTTATFINITGPTSSNLQLTGAAAGLPFVSFYQTSARKGYLQYNGGMLLNVETATEPITFKNGTSAQSLLASFQLGHADFNQEIRMQDQAGVQVANLSQTGDYNGGSVNLMRDLNVNRDLNLIAQERIKNWMLNDNTGWTETATFFTIGSGVATCTAAARTLTDTTFTPVAGRTYLLSFDMTAWGSGGVTATLGGTVTAAATAVRNYVFYITTINTNKLVFTCSSGAQNFSIDNIHVYDLNSPLGVFGGIKNTEVFADGKITTDSNIEMNTIGAYITGGGIDANVRKLIFNNKLTTPNNSDANLYTATFYGTGNFKSDIQLNNASGGLREVLSGGIAFIQAGAGSTDEDAELYFSRWATGSGNILNFYAYATNTDFNSSVFNISAKNARFNMPNRGDINAHDANMNGAVKGNYFSTDGTKGKTGTVTFYSENSPELPLQNVVTVKNGIITSWTQGGTEILTG